MADLTPAFCATKAHALAPSGPGVRGQSPCRAAEPPLHLDPVQTSSQSLDSVERDCFSLHDRTPESLPFEHRGWHAVRMRIADALDETEAPLARRWKYAQCGDDTFVYQNAATGEIDFHGSRCNDRFCMVCGAIRSRRIAAALQPLVERETTRFVTLTVRSKPGDTLAALIDKLSDGWKELRRMKFWQQHVRGGAIMLEVKYSKTSGGHWHPHYHLLCHGTWLDQEQLRAAWKAITRDSEQVNVKLVRDAGEALAYVTKYASKPMDASFTMRPHLLREAITTLKGRRLCACFGSWYGTPLNDHVGDEDEELPPFTAWVYMGTERDLECRASGGDREASKLLSALVRARALRHALSERCTSPPKVHAASDASDACITASTANDASAYHGGG